MVPAILTGLAIWSAIGIIAFNLYVVFVFRTGIVYTARNRNGTLKREMSWQGVLASASILILSIAMLLLFDYFSLRTLPQSLLFWQIFLLNYALYGILFLYDTLVIDILVLAIWRPGFLRIPQQMNTESMRVHVQASLARGGFIVGILALVSTVIGYLTFME